MKKEQESRERIKKEVIRRLVNTVNYQFKEVELQMEALGLHEVIEVSLALNLLGEKGEKRKTGNCRTKSRVSDCNRHNH